LAQGHIPLARPNQLPRSLAGPRLGAAQRA
jgi:hypothetical protein